MCYVQNGKVDNFVPKSIFLFFFFFFLKNAKKPLHVVCKWILIQKNKLYLFLSMVIGKYYPLLTPIRIQNSEFRIPKPTYFFF